MVDKVERTIIPSSYISNSLTHEQKKDISKLEVQKFTNDDFKNMKGSVFYSNNSTLFKHIDTSNYTLAESEAGVLYNITS